MGCCGDREKQKQIRAEQKWDYITLDDFRSSSCLTPFSYFLVYVFLIVSIAVYSVDTFTAVQLLAFSHWAGEIEPSIPFSISRWIFAVCIILSVVLLVYRWIRAIRAIRTGGVAESYMDPLAVRIQSIRMGKRGRGWKRFLVFAELTKSKKGAEYIALFAYFSFESWLRVVFAEGPRQVVNAITLYSVMQLNLIPEGKTGTSAIEQFFTNVKVLAEKNDRQAVVLFGMLFTLLIWVISVLSLASSVILYLIFLWHHIPTEDGSLRAYCRRKINTRLERIVKQKVNKALAKGLVLQDRKPTQPNIGLGEDVKPSLPTLPAVAGLDNDKLPNMPLSRTATQATLPPYTSRPGTSAANEKPGSLRQPTLPDLGLDNKYPLTRTATQGSSFDESSFVENAGVMGYSPLDRYQPSPAPSVPTLPAIPRSYTPVSGPYNGPSQGQGYGYPPRGPMGRPGVMPPDRVNSPASIPPNRSFTPMGNPLGRPGVMPPDRVNSPASIPPNRSFTPVGNQLGRPGIMPPDRVNSPASIPPNRSFTPMGNPLGRPGVMPPDRVNSPASIPPNRSFTPMGNPPGRPFSPAVNAPDRPFSPSVNSISGRDGYSNRQYTPAVNAPDRPFSPSVNSISGRDGYSNRQYTPAVNAPDRPFSPSVNSISGRDGYSNRQYSPAVNAPDRPFSPSVNSLSGRDGYSNRQYSPADGNTTASPTGDEGYVAFNPGMAPRAPEPRSLTPTSPSDSNFTRPNSTPPVQNGSRSPPPRNYAPTRYDTY